ncbi:helix-turn-helix transcriptional regulator [Micromonospora polyrhachis]|uniref:Transcriptional regulator with XRE-family HTH domain n=1 Tax=Micromonospora polyrhachis TaxID=1282883 RepID=A0A7W7WPR6_9ACTN|nr:helix-turn-helix transcriptional regulator [Micromonospora polyrhachis]MBB4959225.1 transcriptional regulator with XRE-family HTH domain [Micromonospora polyrhachis]
MPSGEPDLEPVPVSPLAARIVLARDLRRLREDHGLTQEELAALVGRDRVAIIRAEQHKIGVSAGLVVDVLEALKISPDSALYTTLVGVARYAERPGWWQRRAFAGMGAAQVTAARLEQGAKIYEYNPHVLSGLLQTEEYARFRVHATSQSASPSTEQVVRGRLRRQEVLHGSHPTRLTVVVEEAAIYDRVVNTRVALGQLHHLVGIITEQANVDLRVLPVRARLADGPAPRSPFTIYRYNDLDLRVVVVDTVYKDYLVPDDDDAGQAEVRDYVELFGRLLNAAHGPNESMRLLQSAIKTLTAELNS